AEKIERLQAECRLFTLPEALEARRREIGMRRKTQGQLRVELSTLDRKIVETSKNPPDLNMVAALRIVVTERWGRKTWLKVSKEAGQLLSGRRRARLPEAEQPPISPPPSPPSPPTPPPVSDGKALVVQREIRARRTRPALHKAGELYEVYPRALPERPP